MDDPDPSATEARGTVGHVVIVADGEVPSRDALDAAWPGWAHGVTEVVAADGGFGRAPGAGLRPTRLVGDLDSIAPALLAAVEAEGIPVLHAQAAKDESDTELALLEAARLDAGRITVLGAFGGPRLDHLLANVWLLAHPAVRGRAVVLLSATARLSLVDAPDDRGRPVTRRLAGPPGGLVSLIPFGGDAVGVTTRDLEYPLHDEPLRTGPARGLSNVRSGPDAAVTVTSGRVLVVETALLEVAPDAPGLSSGA